VQLAPCGRRQVVDFIHPFSISPVYEPRGRGFEPCQPREF
jgi:hypothetical protein